MNGIFKKIVSLLDKNVNSFSDILEIKKGYDGTISMEHTAKYPNRTIDIDFENEKECMNYLNSLE